MEERGKGRSCENEYGIMDFRRCGMGDSFYVRPGERYIDRFGVMRYNNRELECRLENDSSDIISVRKISFNTKDSVDDITAGSKPNRHGGYNGFGADPDERY